MVKFARCFVYGKIRNFFKKTQIPVRDFWVKKIPYGIFLIPYGNFFYPKNYPVREKNMDMPDRQIDLFIRFCIQNNGRLSVRKRHSHFEFLSDQEVTQLEHSVLSAYGPDNRETPVSRA